MNTAVQTNLAGGISAAMNSSNANPPSAVAPAVWSTTGYLQTRPTGNAYTLIKATFVNATGSNVTGIKILYNFTVASPLNEVAFGHLVYYSLTGAANSWQLLATLQSTNSATLSTNVTLASTWNNGSTLYVLFADDNGVNMAGPVHCSQQTSKVACGAGHCRRV